MLPEDDNFTQALLVMLVTNIKSDPCLSSFPGQLPCKTKNKKLYPKRKFLFSGAFKGVPGQIHVSVRLFSRKSINAQ